MGEERTEAHGELAADSAERSSAIPNESGWVTTEVAAAALRVSPRTIRDYINSGELQAKYEGEGVKKRWLVSIDAVHSLRDKRSASGEMPRGRRDTAVGDLIAAANAVDIGELVAAVRDLEHRLGRAEARAELTERAESSLREERERLLSDLSRERERAEQERKKAEEVQGEASRLREELEAERSKGFWRRLFGG
jgi:Helix-turn-helix domain